MMLTSSRKHTFGEPTPPKKPRVYRESKTQKKVVKWLRADPNWMVMRLENAARRSRAQAQRDKQLGLEPGAPDLILIYKTQVVWLELKQDSGERSPAQISVHAQLRARNQIIITGYGHANAILKLTEVAKAIDNALHADAS